MPTTYQRFPESVTVCFLSREPATDFEDYESCSLSGTSYNILRRSDKHPEVHDDAFGDEFVSLVEVIEGDERQFDVAARGFKA